MTKRPKNVCGSCGYRWYPRGKNLSRKCPNCGSGSVSITLFEKVQGAIAVLAIVFVGFVVLLSLVPNAEEHSGSPSPRSSRSGTSHEAEQLPAAHPDPLSEAPDPVEPEAREEESQEPDPESLEVVSSPSPAPVPDLEVASVYGAVVGSSYWAKGKVVNKGDATATGVVVRVQLLDGEVVTAKWRLRSPIRSRPGTRSSSKPPTLAKGSSASPTSRQA